MLELYQYYILARPVLFYYERCSSSCHNCVLNNFSCRTRPLTPGCERD